MRHTHLSDDRLIDLCLASPPRVEPTDLEGCPQCEARHAALAALLAEIAAAAEVEACAVFPDERLARQRARILHRLEQEDRPGRIISFPATGQAPDLLLRRTRPAMRWVAAAAAAAFIIGLAAGHLAHDLPENTGPAAVRMAAAPAPGAASYRAVAAISDEEFLGQVELAAGRSSPVPLRPLDALTPRAWDVR